MRTEPRWPAVIAVLAVGGIYVAIPDYLSLGRVAHSAIDEDGSKLLRRF